MGELSIDQARELDAADPLAGFRERFVFDDPSLTYLNGNSLGRLPKATRQRLEQVINTEWGAALGRSWDHWVDLPAQAGEAVASLIGAAPGQTIVTDNTTVNLYKLASAAIDARPGRHVIVTDNDNFPTDRYVLEGIARQHNLEFRLLSTDLKEGVDADLLSRVVDDDTALVSLSYVAYRSGTLADMSALTQIVHESGALMLWDLCHAVGAVPIHLDECDADMAVGCTYKYLNASPGAPAFAYVAACLRDVLRQPVWGWFSHQDHAMGPEYQPAESMIKFLTGTPDILGTVAVEEGAKLIAEAGIDRIRAKSIRLTTYLAELADEWLLPLGCELATPRDPGRRGSHLTFRHPDAKAIVAELAKSNVVVAGYRTPGRIRFGLSPLTTRFADVHNAAAATRDLLVHRNISKRA
jgi:kynureninase